MVSFHFSKKMSERLEKKHLGIPPSLCYNLYSKYLVKMKNFLNPFGGIPRFYV